MYNKPAATFLRAGNTKLAPGDSMSTTAVYNKTSAPEGLVHHDDGNGQWLRITRLMTDSGRSKGLGPARLARVLLTELA
jgi:hypothetical protein